MACKLLCSLYYPSSAAAPLPEEVRSALSADQALELVMRWAIQATRSFIISPRRSLPFPTLAAGCGTPNRQSAPRQQKQWSWRSGGTIDIHSFSLATPAPPSPPPQVVVLVQIRPPGTRARSRRLLRAPRAHGPGPGLQAEPADAGGGLGDAGAAPRRPAAAGAEAGVLRRDMGERVWGDPHSVS